MTKEKKKLLTERVQRLAGVVGRVSESRYEHDKVMGQAICELHAVHSELNMLLSAKKSKPTWPGTHIAQCPRHGIPDSLQSKAPACTCGN